MKKYCRAISLFQVTFRKKILINLLVFYLLFTKHITTYTVSILTGAIVNSDLNSPCFAWHPYRKLGLFKTELVIVNCTEMKLTDGLLLHFAIFKFTSNGPI